jgi:L-ascorbate metabolism protein UlaG (beta-lactamase superfamily)
MIRHLVLPGAVLAAAATLASPLAAQEVTRAGPTKPISVQWLGHAAFEIVSSGGTRILIDPFLTGNPSTPDSLKALSRYNGATKPAAILVSHSHGDHAADAKAIAVASGAPVIGAYDWVGTLGLPAAQTLGGNVGGAFTIGDVKISLVPAMHGSEPGGRPTGFILQFADGRTLYHTGDTWIFGDMALIQEIYHPDIILLGVGGGPYTQDPETAALAIRKYFRPTVIIPMHYATFPGLATENQVRSAFAGDGRLMVMKPGEAKKL